MTEQLVVQNLLRKKLIETQEANPRVSLRAFAKRAGIHSGACSSILSGKRNVSRKLAERICRNLGLDPQERSEVLKHFPEKKRREPQLGEEGLPQSDYLQLRAAQFRVVSEWEHFAILSLIKTKGFQSDPEWISQRLGISKVKVEQALRRLLDAGLLLKDTNGNFKRSTPKVRSTDDIEDLSVKKAHEETLDLARESILNHKVTERDFTFLTLSFDPKKLSMAKELIRKFQDDFYHLVESKNETEVYRLSMQFFPLTILKNME